MLSTVCMGVVVLTRWLWMQPRRLLRVSLHGRHPLTRPLPRAHNSLSLRAHLHHPLFPPDTPQTLPLPQCPSPSATAPTPSPHRGADPPPPHPVQASEASVTRGHHPALLGLWFLPTPRFQCRPHTTPSSSLWGLAHRLPVRPHSPCPRLSGWVLDRLPLPPGSHRLGTSSFTCMWVCSASTLKLNVEKPDCSVCWRAYD